MVLRKKVRPVAARGRKGKGEGQSGRGWGGAETVSHFTPDERVSNAVTTLFLQEC